MNTKQKNELIIILIIVLFVTSCTFGISSVKATTYYNVTISNDGNGSIFLHVNADPAQYYFSSGTHSYPSGTAVRFTATPKTGYHFAYFSFSGISNGKTSVNPLYTTILSSFSIEAHFVQDTVYYNININSSSHGSMSIYYNGNTYFSGTISVLAGSEITLQSIPDDGYAFYQFILGSAVFNSDPFSIFASGDMTITPYFIPINSVNNTYLLTLSNPDNNAGVSMQTQALDGFNTISGSQAGTYQVPYNSQVTFNALANNGFSLSRVVLNDTIIDLSTLPIIFTVTGNTTVTVNTISNTLPDNSSGIPTISKSDIAIGIYIVSIVGIVLAFYFLHNTNIPFAIGLGLIIGTVFCAVLDLLGIYTYPIIALIIICIFGILFFMRH
jgi:hypothetical protein